MDGGTEERMEEQENGWWSKGMGEGAGEWMEEQGNGWRSSMWSPQGWRRADKGDCTPKAH